MQYNLINERNEQLNVIEQIFINRNFTLDQMEHYLNTTSNDLLSPATLDNIELGAKMLLMHLYNQDKIFIIVDSDCDGYTSAAILINYLNKLLPGYTQTCISYKLHPGKEHGIVLDDIPEGTKLVIVPDGGSNDIEQHAVLASQGIDVLVLDHHEVEQKSLHACVINNQSCNYSNKTLSGAGIVYKFCDYLDSYSDYNYAQDFLDLAALGIIADVMNLTNYETHEIIKEGLANINNKCFAQLINNQAYKIGNTITPFKVAFYVAPYINAVVRMGTMEEKLLFFESMLDYKATELIPSTKRGHKPGEQETRVEQACRTANNIKNRQAKARDASLEIVEDYIVQNNLLQNPVLIIKMDIPIEDNLTGLIANQLMGEYMRPVILLKPYVETDPLTGEVLASMWRGSARNSTYSKLTNLREFLLDSNLTEYCSGHASAFGISIPKDNIEAFEKYVYTSLSTEDIQISYQVDFIWSGNTIHNHVQDILKIAEYKDIWGQGIEEPKIAISNIHITTDNIILMSPEKSPTIKIKCDDGLSLIKFKASKEEFETLCPNSNLGCVIINAIGTCEMNEWNGNISPQIIIDDYEIISKTAYYF